MHEIVERDGDSCIELGFIALENGMVIDYIELMKYLAMHDMEWIWPSVKYSELWGEGVQELCAQYGTDCASMLELMSST